MNVLFVCSRNRLRSPTAEHLFAGRHGVQTASAGTAPDSEQPVTDELLRWADIVFVMQRVHGERLRAKFSASLRSRRIVCLGIADDYDYMAPELVRLLEERVPRHLRHE